MKNLPLWIIAAAVVVLALAGWVQKDNLGGVPGVNLYPQTYEELAFDLSSDTTLTYSQSGATFYATASGSTTTLPAVRDGVVYRFVIGGAIDTVDWIIKSAEGDNIEGSLIVAGAVVDCDASDQINFVVDGENLGDFVELRSNGTKWFVTQSNALTGSKLTCSG